MTLTKTDKKEKGILLEIDYVNQIINDKEKSLVRLLIKTKKEIKSVLVEDCSPYLYAVPIHSEKEQIEKLKKEILSSNLKANYSGKDFEETSDFENEGKNKINENEIKACKIEIVKKNQENVLKIYFNKVHELVLSRKSLAEFSGIKELREYDIPFAERYAMDNQLCLTSWIEFESENGFLKNLKQLKEEIVGVQDLNLLAFDFETYCPEKDFAKPENNEIIMASIVTEKEKMVFTTKKIEGKEIIYCENEAELIQKLVNKFNELKPDVIFTYNGDMFDLPVWKARARKYGLDVEIGFEKSNPKTMRKGMFNVEKTSGVQHVDVYKIIRFLSMISAIDVSRFNLESVYESVFNKKKIDFEPSQLQQIFTNGTKKELLEVAEYNKQDSIATFELGEKFLPLFMQLSQLVKEDLFEVSRQSVGTLVEKLLMLKSVELNYLLPNRPSTSSVEERTQYTFEGAFVKEPIAGLHEKIAVIDFTSYHPSIMIANNISVETMDCKCCEKGFTSPSGQKFCKKQKGFLAGVISEIMTNRKIAKTAMKKFEEKSAEYNVLYARQWALKTLIAAIYGYLGYPRSRWYSRKLVNAVYSWVRYYIQEVMKKAEKKGFVVLYGDSATKERFIPILNENNLIEIKNIEELFEENKEKTFERNQKQVIKLNNIKTLSLNPKTMKVEWTLINEIIRHKCNKKIFRINQKFGETRVTEDHSLLIKENNALKEIKPNELKNKKLIKLELIPKVNTIKEIDLFNEMKNYFYETNYRKKIKTSIIHKDNNFIWFGWTKKTKPIKLKRFIKVDSIEFKAMCELLGAYIAEGSSTTKETCKTKSGASIASSNKEWLERMQKNYQVLFDNVKSKIIPSMKKERTLTYSNSKGTKTIKYFDKTLKLQMPNELAAVFFKCLCGQKSNAKKLPKFIFNVPDTFKTILLNDYIAGDGSRTVNEKLGYSQKYKEKNYRLETKSLALASGLTLLLTQLNQKHSIRFRKEKQTYSIQTSSNYNERTETKVNEENYSGFVYDLNTNNSNFVDACGLILLHNTDGAYLQIPKDKSIDDVKKFVNEINSDLPSPMELSFEKYYKRGLFVTKKDGGSAKKRYAMIDENDKLKIVGFEFVRRDWANIAKETQQKVLEIVLKEGDPKKAIELVKKVIADLKSGKVKKSELSIMTQITKPLNEYASINPHVAAALKAIKRGKKLGSGSMIEFIITKQGKTISDKAQLAEFADEGDYDVDYYIENQLIPAVIKIIQEFGFSKEDLIQGGKQAKLF